MIKIQNPNRGPSGWGKSVLLIIVLVLVVGLAAAPSAQAVPGQQDTVLQTLINKAETNGTVRIIVGLNVDGFLPYGELHSPSTINNQIETINKTQEQIWQRLANTKSTLLATYTYFPLIALEVDSTALAILSDLPQVTTIQEDEISAPSLASSIPVIGADKAWAAGFTGTGQTIAILDTGVNKYHDYFADGNSGTRIVSEACYSSSNTNYSYLGITSFCPGGTFSSTAPDSGLNCPTTVTGCYHGTHVAGIVAGDNGSGPNYGVARDATIIAIQVFTKFTDSISTHYCANSGLGSPCALSFTSDQISGLDHVLWLHNNTNLNIASVNMSLGGESFATTCDNDSRSGPITALRDVGIATIVATGNDGYSNKISAPSCISSAISVGATNDFDSIASFSNIATFMDFFAPGFDIVSSKPETTSAEGSANGTSMATPHVAGAWAVIKSFVPDATIDEILAALKSTGTPINIGGGTYIPRINVNLAVQTFNIPPVANNDGAPTPLNTSVTINVVINDTDTNGDTLSIDSVGTPAHGTAVKVSSTSIQYTPTTDYSGVDSFTYTISDGNGGSDTGTVFVIVDGQSVFLPIVLKN